MMEASFVFSDLDRNMNASQPFKVKLDVVNEDDEPLSDYDGAISITAITTTTVLKEGFDDKALGGWTPAFLPGHYEHGFDDKVCAPGSSSSLFLKGGNDSNFGMTLKLPVQSGLGSDVEGAIVSAADGDGGEVHGTFRPQSVSFYVRTNNERADAGHFILGESNEVNKRVAQFQFTKDGKMGLLGTGGVTHGATPYEPDRWYFVELRFAWDKKVVAFYVDHVLQKREIPFRRPTSSFIGACALGNRDRCTTWFDSIAFVTEAQLAQAEAHARGGHAEAWVGPLREDLCAAALREGFVLRAEDGAGRFSVSQLFRPLEALEGAQRHALNAEALADFTSLLDDASSSDVSFLVEGRTLRAHRCILTARCEAFRVMFNSAMREGSAACPQVPIQEVGHAAFGVFLQYIYGGAVHVPDEIAVELLGLADRYLLDGLKLLCGFTLTKMITVDTVARIIQAADRWDTPASRLKQDCLEFIRANFEEVAGSPTWSELAGSPHLLLEITRVIAPLVKPSPAGSASAASPGSASAPVKRQRRG